MSVEFGHALQFELGFNHFVDFLGLERGVGCSYPVLDVLLLAVAVLLKELFEHVEIFIIMLPTKFECIDLD